jgi:hypothetical protein
MDVNSYIVFAHIFFQDIRYRITLKSNRDLLWIILVPRGPIRCTVYTNDGVSINRVLEREDWWTSLRRFGEVVGFVATAEGLNEVIPSGTYLIDRIIFGTCVLSLFTPTEGDLSIERFSAVNGHYLLEDVLDGLLTPSTLYIKITMFV